jgi:hypothetical protein
MDESCKHPILVRFIQRSTTINHLVHEAGEAVELTDRAGHLPRRRVPAAAVDGQQRLGERLPQLVQALRQRVLELARGPLQRAHRRALRLRERAQLRRQRPEQVGRPEAADPEEEALGGGPPRARQHQERVAPRRGGLEAEQRVVVREAGVHERAQVGLRRVRLKRRAQLAGVPGLLLRPVRVLQLQRGGRGTWENRGSEHTRV